MRGQYFCKEAITNVFIYLQLITRALITRLCFFLFRFVPSCTVFNDLSQYILLTRSFFVYICRDFRRSVIVRRR